MLNDFTYLITDEVHFSHLIIWLKCYLPACFTAITPSPIVLNAHFAGRSSETMSSSILHRTYVCAIIHSVIHSCLYGSWFLFYSMDNNPSPSLLILMLKLPPIWWVGKFSSWILDPSNMSLSFFEHVLAFWHKTVQGYFIFVSSVPILKSCHFSREPRFLPMQNGSFFSTQS